MSRSRLLAAILVGGVAAGAAALAPAGGSGTVVAACTGGDAIDFDCQERRYVELVQSAGPAVALQDLDDGMAGSGYLRAACHQLAHRIGRAAGATAGIGAFADGDPVCASGYYHGVTEAAMTKLGAGASVRNASTVCAGLRKRSLDHSNCIHGMGHGYMGVLRRDLAASLKGCDALTDSGDRHGCYSGVFMENLAAVDRPDHESLRPDEPLYPCTAVARRYREECYDRQSTYALFVSGGDFGAVFRLCARTEREFRGACYRGLGGDVAAETATIDGRAEQARARRRLCMRAAGSAARSACVSGAAGVILKNLDGGPAELDAFCASFAVSATQPQHAACLLASEKAYRELLAQQTGQGSDQAVPAGLPGFVCHLTKSGRRQRST